MYIDQATLASTITNVDNGGSDIRITAPAHGLTTGDTVLISGVGGTTEANGTFVVTVLSSSQFTLDSTTFTNAWTGGGGVYTGWRLQLSLGASDYDCHVLVSYKKFANGSVVAIETVGYIVSTATTILLASDPTYAFSVEEISLFSTEASGDIAMTLQMLNKTGTAFKRTYATIDAGHTWVLGPNGAEEYTETGKRLGEASVI